MALARALVHEPRLVLFDEPLSNLDAQLRDQMRLELKVLQDRLRFTAIYVTHDQAEAFALAESVVVMNRGRIETIGVAARRSSDVRVRRSLRASSGSMYGREHCWGRRPTGRMGSVTRKWRWLTGFRSGA